MFLIYSTISAQDISARQKTSVQIMAINKKFCQSTSEQTTKAIELAAIYIIHGEYKNMKQQMLKARSFSKNADCQKSIDEFLGK